MEIGMLWRDADPNRSLAEKVIRAATYYARKYGQPADLCYAHPSMVAEEGQQCGAVRVKPDREILPNHFWIGVSKAGREK